jgi:hypothetical protein
MESRCVIERKRVSSTFTHLPRCGHPKRAGQSLPGTGDSRVASSSGCRTRLRPRFGPHGEADRLISLTRSKLLSISLRDTAASQERLGTGPPWCGASVTSSARRTRAS